MPVHLRKNRGVCCCKAVCSSGTKLQTACGSKGSGYRAETSPGCRLLNIAFLEIYPAPAGLQEIVAGTMRRLRVRSCSWPTVWGHLKFAVGVLLGRNSPDLRPPDED